MFHKKGATVCSGCNLHVLRTPVLTPSMTCRIVFNPPGNPCADWFVHVISSSDDDDDDDDGAGVVIVPGSDDEVEGPHGSSGFQDKDVSRGIHDALDILYTLDMYNVQIHTVIQWCIGRQR